MLRGENMILHFCKKENMIEALESNHLKEHHFGLLSFMCQ